MKFFVPFSEMDLSDLTYKFETFLEGTSRQTREKEF